MDRDVTDLSVAIKVMLSFKNLIGGSENPSKRIRKGI